MEARKWLKRKYPKTFDEVSEFLNDVQLSEFKVRKYKLGRLIRDVSTMSDTNYGKGTILMFKRSNPVWSYNYPMHHGIVKCDIGFTHSGYHSISIWDGDFIEIKE